MRKHKESVMDADEAAGWALIRATRAAAKGLNGEVYGEALAYLLGDFLRGFVRSVEPSLRDDAVREARKILSKAEALAFADTPRGEAN